MKGRAVILLLVLSVFQSVYAENVGSNSVLAPTQLQKNTCYECHVGLKDAKMSDPAKAWEESVHKENDITCERCHSPVVPSGRLAAVGEYGGSYRDDHADMRLDVEFRAPAAYPVEGSKGEYTLTVRKGLNKQQLIAVCARCHGLSPQDPENPKDVFPAYKYDIHGQTAMVNLGNPTRMAAVGLEAPVSEDSKDAAVCTDCHDPHKTVRAKNLSKQAMTSTCAGGVIGEKCHSSDAVAKKYGISNAYETYQDNINGRQLTIGNPNAPGCADCHGAHGILPQKDPTSRTNPVNLEKVCSQKDCHANYENVKLQGKVHLSFPPPAAEAPVEYISYLSMAGLLLLVMVVFLPLVALDITRKAGQKLKKGGE